MAMSQPTKSEIRTAKSQAVGGMRKRCRKGKNCSAACIASNMVCLVELPESAGASVGRIAAFLNNRAPSVPSDLKRELGALGGGAVDVEAKTVGKIAEARKPWSATGNTKWAREDAEDFDTELKSKPVRRVGEKGYQGWEDSYKSGASKVGEGSYGTVIKNKDGTYVKRGAISDTEPTIIDKLGRADLGPRLKAADIDGKHDWHEEKFVNIRSGRIAMTGVPGEPIGSARPNDKVAGKNMADIYWKAMSDLHRLGIAHNDAHIDNILVDNQGKGRWVDLGLAQQSPKAAFAEAFGVFSPSNRQGSNWRTGNWQTPRWDATGVKSYNREDESGRGKAYLSSNNYREFAKVIENKPKVLNKLRSLGFTVSEIETLVNTPIRSESSVFEKGPWAKMTDSQANELIKTFYDGI